MSDAPARSIYGTRAYHDLPFACACGERWSGAGTCHCGSCHRTFAGYVGFDSHRVGGRCSDPRGIVGMHLATDKAYRCWYGQRRRGEE